MLQSKNCYRSSLTVTASGNNGNTLNMQAINVLQFAVKAVTVVTAFLRPS